MELTSTGNTWAPGMDRNEKGRVILPRDVEWRREMFPSDGDFNVFDHPGKMQMYIVKESIEFLEREGRLKSPGLILDPFGGTGTTALACSMGYNVNLIELEPIYLDLLKKVKEKWREQGHGDWASRLAVIPGDTRVVMHQLPTDAYDLVLTSPPYANLQVGKEVTEFTGQLAAEKANMRKYGSSESSPFNFGRLSTFVFNQHMLEVYREINRVLKPGGLYVSVTKDQMRAGSRNMLKAEVVRQAQEGGLKYTGWWWRWAPPGSFLGTVMKAKGSEVVDDEDVIVFEKGE